MFDANNTLKKSLEDKKMQAIEAAKKAKAKVKKGTKGKADEDEVNDEYVKPEQIIKEENFDLFVPASFERALNSKIQRPFVFGPIEFDNLNMNDE